MPDTIKPDPLMSPAETAALLAEHGPCYTSWEYYARWLRRWRDEHPEDGRDDLQLIDEFVAETDRETADG